jgi:maltose O-acetyltransferase
LYGRCVAIPLLTSGVGIIKFVKRVGRDVLLNGVVASPLIPNTQRWRLLKLAGMHVAPSVVAAGGFFGGTNISVGRDTFINYQVFLDNAAAISIGQNCQIGPGVMICTGTHELGPSIRRAGAPTPRPVVIEDGVWLGTRAVVLPGVTVGRGCVIAAGAVVREDCAPNGMYAGVPAVRRSELHHTPLDHTVPR